MLKGGSVRSTSLICALLFATCATAYLPAQHGSPAQSSPSLVTQTVDNARRTTLTGNVHPLARREFDQGEAPADLPLDRMLMILKRSPQQEAALQRLLEDQQDMHSSNYHQWLTPQQFGERFGPVAADIDAVTQWLTSNGLQVSQISRSRLFIEFSGNAAQVKQAFGTPIHSFVINGERHWANAGNPTIPTALAPVVAGVDSLHNFLKQAQHISLGTYSAASRKLLSPSPAYTLLGSTGEPNEYALVPYDFAAIYDLLPLWTATPTAITGAGQIIAIVGRSDINPADAPAFWSFFGLDGVHAADQTR
jgi:subtilase family serine protease